MDIILIPILFSSSCCKHQTWYFIYDGYPLYNWSYIFVSANNTLKIQIKFNTYYIDTVDFDYKENTSVSKESSKEKIVNK